MAEPVPGLKAGRRPMPLCLVVWAMTPLCLRLRLRLTVDGISHKRHRRTLKHTCALACARMSTAHLLVTDYTRQPQTLVHRCSVIVSSPATRRGTSAKAAGSAQVAVFGKVKQKKTKGIESERGRAPVPMEPLPPTTAPYPSPFTFRSSLSSRLPCQLTTADIFERRARFSP
jgi:hypothetical protein